MVSLIEHNDIIQHASKDPELGGFYSLLNREPVNIHKRTGFPHEKLIASIAENDKGGFESQIKDLEQRKIKEGSEWYENDCLVFSILLGTDMFQTNSDLVNRVLSAREMNRNDTARWLNQAFRALSRGEYGMEGKYCFVKIPYLHLLNRLSLDDASAAKAYKELTQIDLINELSPFLQLLAIRAYDLLILEREPRSFAKFHDVLKAIEELPEKLSLRQIFQLLGSAPLKMWVWLFSAIVVLVPLIGGVGYRVAEMWLSNSSNGSPPYELSIAESEDATKSDVREVRALSSQLMMEHQVQGTYAKCVVIKTSLFGKKTSAFSVEISEQPFGIADGFAFLSENVRGHGSLISLPVQMKGTNIRAEIPASSASSYLSVIALVRVPPTMDSALAFGGFSLRTADH